jgi:hypothetical protein
VTLVVVAAAAAEVVAAAAEVVAVAAAAEVAAAAAAVAAAAEAVVMTPSPPGPPKMNSYSSMFGRLSKCLLENDFRKCSSQSGFVSVHLRTLCGEVSAEGKIFVGSVVR